MYFPSVPRFGVIESGHAEKIYWLEEYESGKFLITRIHRSRVLIKDAFLVAIGSEKTHYSVWSKTMLG